MVIIRNRWSSLEIDGYFFIVIDIVFDFMILSISLPLWIKKPHPLKR